MRSSAMDACTSRTSPILIKGVPAVAEMLMPASKVNRTNHIGQGLLCEDHLQMERYHTTSPGTNQTSGLEECQS